MNFILRRNLRCSIFCSICGLLMCVQAAYAIKITSETAQHPVSSNKKAAFDGLVSRESRAADDNNTMREGVIQDIDFKKQIMRIHNTVLAFHANQLKVFASGHISSMTMLAKGRKIRFLLDAQDPARRLVSVVYLN